jgi:hypothetical protein
MWAKQPAVTSPRDSARGDEHWRRHGAEVRARLGATRTNDLPVRRTYMDSRPGTCPRSRINVNGSGCPCGYLRITSWPVSPELACRARYGPRCAGARRRPGSGDQLAGDASHQDGAHRAGLLVEMAVQLVVDVVPVGLALGPPVKPSADTGIIRMIFLPTGSGRLGGRAQPWAR